MRRVLAGGLSAAIGLAFCTGAQASGFAISDKSVSSLGTAFAGEAALAENASTVYNNPAGMLQLSGSHLSVAVHRITTSAEFTGDSGATADADVNVFIPNFYYVTELNPDVRAGFGFNSPFGLGLEYDSEWLGRYHTIESNMRTFNLIPAVAFRAGPQLAIGASLDVQYLNAELLQAVDFGGICVAQQMLGGADQTTALATCNAIGLQPQQDDGTQQLTGDSWSYGFSLGMTYQMSEATRLGAVLHSAVRHEIHGDSDFTLPPSAAPLAATFTDSAGTVVMMMPEIVSLSLAHRVSERLTFLADYTWTGWSRNKELRVEFDNALPDSVCRDEWNDASRYAVGLNYRLNPAWLLRAGFAYDETPVPDAEHRSPRLPDTDRRWFTIGANWAPEPDFSVDVTYAYVSAKEIPMDNTDALGHSVEGSYDIWGDFFSVQANWKF